MSSIWSKLVNLGGLITGTLGIGNGGTGQTTATTAFNALSPTTTRGDLIRRGATNNDAFSASTTNRVVRGDGTDVVSGQIDNPAFFTTGAELAQSVAGVVKGAGQLLGTNTNDAAGAGYVGQVVSTGAVTNTSIGTSATDVTGASITLTAGNWQIFYSLEGETDTGSSLGDRTLGDLQVYTSANVAVAGTYARMGIKTTAVVVSALNTRLIGQGLISISGSTTYKLRGARTDVAGTGTFTVLGSDAQFYAMRVR